MILHTKFTISFKCYSCGKYIFKELSLFDGITDKSNITFCSCGKNYLKIVKTKKDEYSISFKCFSCSNIHKYRIYTKKIIEYSLNILYCRTTGMQNCFIGNDFEVFRKVDIIEKQLDNILDDEYGKYFNNSFVMIEVVNRVNELLERNDIECSCGRSALKVDLLRKAVLISCQLCDNYGIIKSETNNDLKNFLKLSQVILKKNKKSN